MTAEVLISSLLAIGLAQSIKILIDLTTKRKPAELGELVVTGGMPSAHAAAVVALSTSIYLVEGITSAFVIALVLTLIVIRDATGVRRTVGREGYTINQIITKLKLKLPQQAYAQGHKPLEATVGAIIGFGIAMVVHFFLKIP